MTRFVVRPTGPSESDGYSVVDKSREDEKGKQIGRGLWRSEANDLAELLNGASKAIDVMDLEDCGRLRILAVLAACADAHDDYLSEEERRANREASERSTEQASKMPAALRLCLSALESYDSCLFAREFERARIDARKVIVVAREALG